MLLDRYDRQVTYLRLSLTDRCNLRCQYCMPAEGLAWIPSEKILQDDEIITLLRDVYVPLGVSKVRLTGGEPMLRRHLVDLVGRIAAIPGIDDLAMTTNGMFLAPHAQALREAGLRRLNVSVDSLNPQRFAEITRGGDLARVLAGVDAALAAGFDVVKLNTVIIAGSNDAEVVDFATLTLDKALHVRFIEMMHVGDKAFFDQKQYVAVETMVERIKARYDLVTPDHAPTGNGPARHLQIAGAKGTLGFISPMSVNFCHACNRSRLTADGQIKACLMRPQEHDLLGALRRGEPVARLQEMVLTSLGNKPLHHEWGADMPITRTMSAIGG
jgi:cyclic pyranopterin phosphate synthase